MNKIIVVFVAIIILILGLTFMPAGGETSEIYSQYIATQNYSSSVNTTREIEIAEEKLTEVVTNSGLIVFTFPLLVGDLKAYDGDLFGSWGENDWRKGTEKHNGTDIAVEGNPTDIVVVSMCTGVVKSAGDAGTAGNRVIIVEERSGLNITYMHLKNNSISVKAGDKITAGDPVGIMGMTGYSFGVHLHVGVTYPGTDLVFETITIGHTSNGLDMYDPRYFAYDKQSFPKNFIKNKERLTEIIFQ